MSRFPGRPFRRGPARDDERRPAQLAWRAALSAAAGIVRDRPGLVAVGLLGFLARGGALIFLLPIVVLPTPTGLSNFIGSQALTAGGPSEGLIWLIAGALVGAVVLILIGTVVGAVADLVLLREAVAFDQARGRPATVGGELGPSAIEPWPAPTPGSLLRITAIRILCMLPAAVAAVWGASRLVASAYHQLILPDDLTVPLAIRVLRDAADAAAAVTATWLAGETIAGLAVRRLIVSGGSIAGALGWALLAPVRRPLTTAATVVLGTTGVVLAVAPLLLVANALWRRLQVLLDGNGPADLTLLTTAGFVAAWILGLVLVGAAATWRSLAWSFEVLRAGRRSEVSTSMERPVDRLPIEHRPATGTVARAGEGGRT